MPQATVARRRAAALEVAVESLGDGDLDYWRVSFRY